MGKQGIIIVVSFECLVLGFEFRASNKMRFFVIESQRLSCPLLCVCEANQRDSQ